MHIHFILHNSGVIRISYASISTVSKDCHLLTFIILLHHWIYILVCPVTVYHSATNWKKKPWSHLYPVVWNTVVRQGPSQCIVPLLKEKHLPVTSKTLLAEFFHKYFISPTLLKKYFLLPSVNWSVDNFLSNFHTKWLILWQQRANVLLPPITDQQYPSN